MDSSEIRGFVSMLASEANDPIWKDIAKITKKLFDELVSAGFSVEQAMAIVVAMAGKK